MTGTGPIRVRRVLVGVCAAAVAGLVIAIDVWTSTPYATGGLVTLLACAALRELYRALGAAGFDVSAGFGIAATAILLIARVVAPSMGLSHVEARELFLAGLAFAVVAPLGLGVARRPPDPDGLRGAAGTAFGLVYVTFLISFLLELRLLGSPAAGFAQGLELCLPMVAAVKVGDSCAYFAGRALGRTPLSPVSPNKTWEGSVAGFGATVVVAVLLGDHFGHDYRLMAGFGVLVSLAGQGGDLAESWVKRAVGIKDSSTSFGAIGGALDMLDALLLASPAAYLWAKLLIVR